MRRWVKVALWIVLLGLVAAAGWWFLSSGTWRRGVGVVEAELWSPAELRLMVDSCQQEARLEALHETDQAVIVRVEASYTPIRSGGLDCLDVVVVPLQGPLGDRIVIDLTTRRQVDVTRVGASSD